MRLRQEQGFELFLLKSRLKGKYKKAKIRLLQTKDKPKWNLKTRLESQAAKDANNEANHLYVSSRLTQVLRKTGWYK